MSQLTTICVLAFSAVTPPVSSPSSLLTPSPSLQGLMETQQTLGPQVAQLGRLTPTCFSSVGLQNLGLESPVLSFEPIWRFKQVKGFLLQSSLLVLQTLCAVDSDTFDSQ